MRISYPLAIAAAAVIATFAGKYIGKDLAPTMSAKLEVHHVADSR